MSDQKLKYQLIADLLTTLENEEFPLGIGDHLELQELISKLPEEMPVEDLKTILCPLFAKNKHDQEYFYEIFRQSLARVKAAQYIPPKGPPPILKPPSNPWEITTKLLGAVFILFLASLIYLRITEADPMKMPDRYPVPFNVEVGDTFNIRLDSLYSEKDTTGEIFQNAEIDFVSFADGRTFDTAEPYGSYSIDSTGLFTFYADSVAGKPRKEIIVLASYDIGIDTTVFFPTIIAAAEEVILPEVESEQPPEEVQPEVVINYLADKPTPYPKKLSGLFPEPEPEWMIFFNRHSWWIKPVLIFLFLAVTGAFFKWYEERQQKIIADIQSKDQAPLLWNISIPQVEKVAYNEDFFKVLHQMRQRTYDDHYILSVPQTIKKTIERAGIIDFQYFQKTRPPEYLLLIDRQSSKNHRAHLYDFLFKAFKANEVYVERFFYEGDVRLCWNEYYPQGIKLKDLAQTYRASRLVVVGTGYQMLNPVSGKLSKWTNVFETWEDRAILSPRPTSQWGGREIQLKNQFLVLPASLQNLTLMVDKMEALDPDEIKSKTDDQIIEPIEFRKGLMPTLFHYYSHIEEDGSIDDSLVQWIAACAIYPSLHWDLTMFLGQELSTDDNYLLTIDNIVQLTRLPWFIDGKIPDQARLELLEYLPEATEMKIRKSLDELFDVLPHPPENSVAFSDSRMSIAMNDYLLTKNRKSKEEYEQYLMAGTDADVTMIKYLEGDKSPTHFEVDRNWKKYAQGKKAEVFPNWVNVLYAFTFIAFVIGVIMYSPEHVDCGGEIVQLHEQPLCVSDKRELLVYREHQIRSLIQQYKYRQVDSLETLAMVEYIAKEGKPFTEHPDSNSYEKMMVWVVEDQSTLAQDTNVIHFYENLSIDFYHVGFPIYNRYLKRKNEIDTLSDNTDFSSQIDSFCVAFERAIKMNKKFTRGYLEQELAIPFKEGNCNVRGSSDSLDFAFNIDVLTGTVIDEVSNNVLSEVLVETSFNSGSTDSKGEFILEATSNSIESVAISFSKEGYLTQELTLSLSELTIDSSNQERRLGIMDPVSLTPDEGTGGNGLYQKVWLTNNKSRPALINRPRYTMLPIKGIVIHTENSGTNARAIRDYFQNTDQFSSTHYVVDSREVLEIIPPNEMAYHMDKTRLTNLGSILKGDARDLGLVTLGIEICNNSGGWSRAYQKAIELATYLLVQNNLTAEDLYRHFDLNTGKVCPRRFKEESAWKKFKQDVNKGLPDRLRLPDEGINFETGIINDSRDGHSYTWVKVDNQIYLTEGIRHETFGSRCYNNQPINCATFGRVYDFLSARAICPKGYRLLTENEFLNLNQYIRGLDEFDKKILINEMGLSGNNIAGSNAKKKGSTEGNRTLPFWSWDEKNDDTEKPKHVDWDFNREQFVIKTGANPKDQKLCRCIQGENSGSALTQKVTLTILVRNVVTNSPQTGYTIRVTNINSLETQTQDSEGKKSDFIFELDQNQDYNVEALVDGQVKDEYPTTTKNLKDLNISHTFPVGLPINNRRIKLRLEVLDDINRPVPNAKVTISRSAKRGNTNEKGVLEIDLIDRIVGKQLGKVEKNGYESATFNIAESEANKSGLINKDIVLKRILEDRTVKLFVYTRGRKGRKDPLVGATIIVEGTTVGITTDVDGRATLTVPGGTGTLVISYSGYSSKKEQIRGPNFNYDETIEIELK